MNKTLIMRIAGIVLIIGAVVFLVVSYISTQNYVKTEATVVSVEYDPSVIYDPDDSATLNDHIVIMEYVVDGKTYKSELHAQQSDYSVGQKTELSYDPNNPGNTASGQMSLPLLIGICAAALIVGAIVIFKSK